MAVTFQLWLYSFADFIHDFLRNNVTALLSYRYTTIKQACTLSASADRTISDGCRNVGKCCWVCD